MQQQRSLGTTSHFPGAMLWILMEDSFFIFYHDFHCNGHWPKRGNFYSVPPVSYPYLRQGYFAICSILCYHICSTHWSSSSTLGPPGRSSGIPIGGHSTKFCCACHNAFCKLAPLLADRAVPSLTAMQRRQKWKKKIRLTLCGHFFMCPQFEALHSLNKPGILLASALTRASEWQYEWLQCHIALPVID